MDVFKLKAVLGLDSSEYDKGLNQKKSEAGNIGSAIGGALGTAAKVGTAAVTAATGAAVAFGATAVNAGKAFDSSMSQVAATMGKTMDEMQNEVGSVDLAWGSFSGNLREYAQEMGAHTAFSAKEAADALNYMALAGYDTQTSMEMLPNVLNLAAAGGMDLATASDMVTDAQSALGLSLDETGEMVDKMAMASSKSNTSVAQLGEAFLTIGATARNVAGGTTELSTVLGVLADNGIKGAEGGTHLRNAILSLQTPTKAGSEALAQLGMSYKDMYDSAGNMRSLPEIFQQLGDKMEGMNQQSKDAIISGLFNKTDLAAVNALIGTTGERWDELTGYIDDAAGSAQKMADTQLDNLEGDVTLFKSALEGAQIAISERLMPSLRDFISFGSDGLSRLTDAFKSDGLSGAMTVFGDLVSEGLQMIISKLPEAVSAGTQLLGAIVEGIATNLPTLLDAAVQIIEMLVQYIGDNADGMADSAAEILSTLLQNLIQNAPQLIKGAIEMLAKLAQGISNNLPSLIPTVVELVLTIVSSLIENAPKLFESALQIILSLAEGLIKSLPKLLAQAPIIVAKLVSAIIQNKLKLAESALELIVKLASELANNFPKIVEKGKEAVVKIVEGIKAEFSKVTDSGKELIDKFIEGIKSLFESVKSIGKQTIDTVKEGIYDKIEDAKEWGKHLISNFVDGLKAKWESLKDKVSGIGDTIAGIFEHSKPRRESPFYGEEKWFPHMFQNLADSVDSSKYILTDALDNAFGDVEPSFDANVSTSGTGRRGGVSVVQNIYSKAKTASELMREAKYEQERAVLMGV